MRLLESGTVAPKPTPTLVSHDLARPLRRTSCTFCCVRLLRRKKRKNVQIRAPSTLWEQPPCHVIYRLSKVSPTRFVPLRCDRLHIYMTRGSFVFAAAAATTQATLHTSAKTPARTSRARRARPSSRIRNSSSNQRRQMETSTCLRSSRTSSCLFSAPTIGGYFLRI